MEYSLHQNAKAKSPPLFRQFKKLLKVLGEIEPVECSEHDLIWQCPWIRVDGRPAVWCGPRIHIYQDTAYVNFDDRHSFQVDLKRREFIGVVFDSPKRGKDFGYEFLEWFFASLTNRIKDFLKSPAGYNRFIDKRLPLRYRFGKIKRKDTWSSDSEDYFVRDELSQDEVEEFKKVIVECDTHTPMESMSRNDFLRSCEICYDAVFPNARTSSPLEKYRRHADGRDDGLLNLPPKDAKAFARWMNSERFGGHPWEIVRGGNSTHISLSPLKKPEGWQLYLDGYSHICAARTVKMAIALNRARIKFDLLEKDHLAKLVEGEDWIGIVPENGSSRSCAADFEIDGERLPSFMHLFAFEGNKAVLEKIHRYPVKPLLPISESTKEKIKSFYDPPRN